MQLVSHRLTGTTVRRATWEGREYLVVPVVAVRGAVLNGELCPAEEIGRYPDAWNGIPVTINHPRRNGRDVSANDPELLATYGIGRFWHASFDGDRLRGEAWIDIEKCRQLGGEALQALQQLEQGQPLDVSTAYWRDVQEGSGVWGGRSYQGIQRNLRPDHLALLPNAVGACSWQDGCGAPRVHKTNRKEVTSKSVFAKKLLSNLAGALGLRVQEMSHEEIEDALRQALRNPTGFEDRWAFIHAIYDDFVVYDDQPPGVAPRLVRRTYSIDAETNQVTLGEPEAVRRVVTYEPIDPASNQGGTARQQGDPVPPPPGPNKAPASNAAGQPPCGDGRGATTNQKGDESVSNRDLVNQLIANQATQFQEADRPWLESLTEDQLKKLVPVASNAAGGAPASTSGTGGQADPAPAGAAPQANTGAQAPQGPRTLDEWFEAIPDPTTKDFVRNAVARYRQQREALIESLVANKQCAFSKDDLAAMNAEQLEKLARSMGVGQPTADWSGLGGPRAHEQDSGPKVPAPQPVVLAPRKEAS